MPGLFSLTQGKYYYWPCSKESPVYEGVIDDEEFTSYLYPTDAALWEIAEDPVITSYSIHYTKLYEASVELKSLIRQYGLPEAFPADVEAEAARSANMILDFNDREDVRGLNVFTIDGADAKDLDDAVSVKKLDDGYELGVHIADVAQYVKEGSKLDKEAFKSYNFV